MKTGAEASFTVIKWLHTTDQSKTDWAVSEFGSLLTQLTFPFDCMES